MDDSDDFFAIGHQPSQITRRLSEPGRPSARLLQDNGTQDVRTRRQSDPGRGHAIFTLRALRDNLNPPMSDGNRFSYATSSATQSFVSMETIDSTPTGSAVAPDVSTSEVPSIPSEAEEESAAAVAPPAGPITPTRGSSGRIPQAGNDQRRAAGTPKRQPTHSFPSPGPENGQSKTNTASGAAAETPGRAGDPRRRETLTGPAKQQPMPGGYGGADVAADAAASSALLRSLEQDATVRAPERQRTRDVAEDVVAAAFAPSRAQEREAIAPAADTTPRRSTKVSSTPTVVPNRRDEELPAPIQESRPPRASTTSNRTPTVSSKEPQTSTLDSRPPRTSTTSRTPTVPSKEPQTPTLDSRPPRTSATSNRTPTFPTQEPQTSTLDSRPPRTSTTSNRTPTVPSKDKEAQTSIPDSRPPRTPNLQLKEEPRTSFQESRPPRASTTSNRPPKSSTETQAQRSPTTPRTMVASTSERGQDEKPAGSRRPPLPMTNSEMRQMDTKYVNMLLAVDSIPAIYNILASFFTWILLAGFVLFPGTFTSLKANSNPNGVLVAAVDVVEHVSLFVIAWVCTGIGAAGMAYLWYRWQANYIWIVNKIFMPGFLNSLAGVISTLASVYGSQSKTFSISSKSTIIVTSALAGICGALTAFYMFVLIRALKKQHDAEVGKQRAGKHGEGFVDLTKRKLGIGGSNV